MVSATLHCEDDVVDGQVLRKEVVFASEAVSSLFTIEVLLILDFMALQDFAQVSTPGNVRPVRATVEQTQFIAHRDLTRSAAFGEIPVPAHWCCIRSVSTHFLAYPQNGPSTMSSSLLDADTTRSMRATGFRVG